MAAKLTPKFLTATQVASVYGIPRSSVYERASDPTDEFPKGINVGDRVTRLVWDVVELDDYFARRKQERDRVEQIAAGALRAERRV